MLGRLLEPVKKTIRAQVGNGRLHAVDRDDEGGQVTYDVEMVKQGKTRNFTVDEDGAVIDTEVFVDELSATVQQAIKNRVGSATLGEIDQSNDAGGTVYSVEMIGGGKTRSFTVDARGKLTDEEVFLAELPPNLQASIRKEVGAGTIDEITRSFEEDGTVYDVDATNSGKTVTFTFDEKAVLQSRSEEIALTEVPDAARKQIQILLKGGKFVTISKVTEDGATSFDVDIRQNGAVKSYTVENDGRLAELDK
jgi:uncharacterized membrane protein YkoI